MTLCCAQAPIDRDHVLAVRQTFFDALVEEWTRLPEAIDALMGQSEHFMVPDPDQKKIEDAARGVLAMSFVAPPSWRVPLKFSYSILHAGDWMRFGLLLSGDARALSLFQKDQSRTLDIEGVWDRPAHQTIREGGFMLEWRFDEPDFYVQYPIRERFIQMARHLHFQVGRAVREAGTDGSSAT